jgi:hypothetical protein
MKIFPATCLLLAVGSAFALPSTSSSTALSKRGSCTPIAYRCHDVTQPPLGQGWDVCDASGNWVWGGACGPDQQCVYNPASQSPYCLPTIVPTCTNGATVCVPGGLQTCIGGTWSTTPCPTGEICSTDAFGVGSCSVPGGSGPCTPATYRCSPGHNGWDVCTTWGEWVDGGDCQSTQTCYFNPLNASPYCVP